MSLEVLAALRTHYPTLTPVEKDIADYVLAHGDEVVYMPITELAFRCSVGVTSIMRFCRRIGRSGYQVFRLELASALEAQRLQGGRSGSEERSGFEKMLDGIYETHYTALQSTRHMLEEDTLRGVVEHLLTARQVYFFGLNRCLSTAMSASQFLMSVLRKGCCAMEPYTQQMLAGMLSPLDAALFLSHSGRSAGLLRIADDAHASGAYTISITCHGESPLSKLCDANLYCGCNADPGRPTDLDKLTGKSSMAFLLETLCAACQSACRNGGCPPDSRDDVTAQKKPPIEAFPEEAFYLAE